MVLSYRIQRPAINTLEIAILQCKNQGGIWDYNKSTCIKKSTNTTSISCPSGEQLIGSVCVPIVSTSTATNTVIYTSTSTSKIHTTIAILQCKNQGGIWDYNKSTCIKKSTNTTSISCPSGEQLIGSVCVPIQTKCPSGYKQNPYGQGCVPIVSTSTATNTVIYTSTSTSTIHTTIYTSTSTSTSTATNTTNVLISDCINAGGTWNSNLGICQFTSPIVSFTSTSTSTQTSTSTSTSTSKVLTSSIFGIPMILIILILVVLMVVMMIK